MKRIHRFASLAPILFLLLTLLLWLHQVVPEDAQPQAGISTSVTLSPEKEQISDVGAEEQSAENRISIDSDDASLWNMSATPLGAANGLRPAIAAASRGRNELPEGRRWKVEKFPDLRTLKEGQRVTVPLPDGRLFSGKVFYSRLDEGYKNRHLISIGFDEDGGSLFVTDDAIDRRRTGRLLINGDRKAWTFTASYNEDVWLREHWREDLICELPALPVAALRSDVLPGDPSVSDSGATAPFLNSRPPASGVLFIDFDGEPATVYPDWGSCVSAAPYAVPHSGLNASQMTFIWRRVAEDFSPFNINVTTSEDVYDAAPVGKRMRILIGATLPPCVRGPGVALMNSFRNTGSSRVPCWMSTDAYGGAMISVESMAAMASNISHEFGHTMGLWHDGMHAPQPSDAEPGASYYPGHGSLPLDWSPIMGGPYRPGGGARAMIQWAKDEYPGANNAQDDLATLASPANGVGFAPDESTAFGNAPALTPLTLGRVGASGVISSETDLDYWQFTIDFAGNGTVEMAPADPGLSCANLDCAFYIADSTLTNLTGPYGGENNLEASVVRYFTPGTYYILAYGQGNLQAADSTGYSAYGSTGRYVVTVQPPVDGTVPTVAITSPAQNTILSGGSVVFQGSATDNHAISNIELHLRRDADGSYWNGTYWQTGMEGAALNNSYNSDTHTWTCTSPLPQVGGSISGFSPGTYTFMARAYDLGAVYSDTTSVVTVDATGPSVAILSPLSGSFLGTPGFTFTGTATENGILQYVVGYIRRNADGHYWNGSSWQSGSSGASLSCNVVQRPSSTIYDWTCTATLPSLGSTLTPGSYNFIAIAVDGVGLTQQRDAVVNVDSTPPVTTLAAPAHNSIITSSSVPFNGTITDNAGVWRVVCFIRRHADNLYWNGSTWIVDPGAANLSASYNSNTHTWTCTATLPQPGGTLANGGYNFIALGFDHAGNVHQVDSVVTVDFHQTYVWNGSGGSDWDIAASWTPNGVPGADDYVLISNGGTVNNHAIRTVYGFRVANGTVTSSAGNSLTFTNDSTWSGGTITGIWNNANGGTIVLNQLPAQTFQSGAVLQNAGLLRNDAGSSTISNAIQQLSSGRILNNGSNLYLSGGGEHQTGSLLDANAGPIYLNGGTHTFLGGGFAGDNWTYCSAGTMLVQGNLGPATGAATGKFGIAGGNVSGSGTISAKNGYFSTGSISGSVILRFTDTFTKPTNTTLNMDGGTVQSEGLFESPGSADFNLDSGNGGGAGTIVNKGTWRTNNAFTYSNTNGGGVFRNEGLFESMTGISMMQPAFLSKPGSTFRSKSGYVRLHGGGVHDPGATFHADGGDIYFSGGTHQLLGGVFTGSGVVYATGGTLSVEGNVGASTGSATGGFGIATGTVTGSAMLSAERGTFSSGTIGGSVVLRLTGNSSKSGSSTLNMNGGTIRNEGTFTQQASGDFNLDNFSGGGAGNLTNIGTWVHSGGANISNTHDNGSIDNFGLWHVSSGNSTNAAYFRHHENSTFRVSAGQMIFTGGSKLEAGATIDAAGGALYQNGGTHTLEGGVIAGANTVYTGGGNTVVTGDVGAVSGPATGGFGIYASGLLSGSAMLSVERGYLAAGSMSGAVILRLTGESNKATNTTLNMNGGTIRNDGTMNVAASGDINLDSGDGGGAGTIVNKGTWRFHNAFSFSNVHGGGVFRNEGLVESMTGISSIAAAFLSESGSTFRAKAGYVRLTGGGVHQAGVTFDTDGGDIYFSGGTHQLLGGTFTGSSHVYATGGTVSVEGNVGTTSGTASGGFGISSGTVVGTGMISTDHGSFLAGTVGGSVTLRHTGNSTKWSGSTLNMNGGTIRNEGTFTQQASGDFNLDNFSGGGAGKLINNGTWIHTGGANISNTHDAGSIDNFGLWHVSSGNSTNAAYFTNHESSTFRVSAGQMIFTGGSRLEAGAVIEVNNGYLYLNGGTHTLEGGSITGTHYVYCGAGLTTVTGDVGASSGAATGGFGIYGSGTLNGSGTISVDHGYLAAGSMGGTVTLRLTGESNKITNTVLNMNGGTIRNEGTMNVAASGDFNLDSSSSAGAGTIHNSGLWKHLGSCNFSNSNLNGVVLNSGTFEVISGTTNMIVPFSNSGTTRVTGGTLSLQRGSTHTGALISNSGVLFVGSGHTLSGSNAFLGGTGSFSGAVSLSNAARIAPGNSAGTLTLFGNVQFLASTEAPALAIEIDSASQFDQVVLGSGSTLSLGNGVTDLQLVLGYRPLPGQIFRIVTAGTGGGAFSGRFRNAPSSGDLLSALHGGNLHQFRVNYDPGNKYIDLVYQSGFQLWMIEKGLTGNDAAFSADPDGDGVSNGIEFILGRDPRPGYPDPLLPNENMPQMDETHFIFTHRRSHASRYLPTVVQFNDDLGTSWNNAQHGVSGVVITVSENFHGAGMDRVETRIPRGLATNGRLFLRLWTEE